MKPNLTAVPQPVEKSNVVRVGFTPSQLTGKGTEYLAKDGKIIFRFMDGMILPVPPRKK